MYYYVTEMSRKKFYPSNFYSLQIFSSFHKRYSNHHPSLKGYRVVSEARMIKEEAPDEFEEIKDGKHQLKR